MRVGTNPELELGRFLTDVSPFPNIAPILGAIEYCEAGQDEPVTLVILQKFIENQGDLWTLILQQLGRIVAAPAATGQAVGVGVASAVESAAADFHLGRMALLGRRVGEMHKALCATTGDARFDPEPVSDRDLAAWKENVEREAHDTLRLVQEAMPGMPAAARETVKPLLGRGERLVERIRGVSCDLAGLVKSRFHGDLHLGQVLASRDDFIIVDFQGELGRSLE